MKRRVLVAAGQPVAAQDLEASLAEADEFQVVRTISGLSEVDETPADVLVVGVDSRLDLLDGLRERRPDLKLIAVGPDDPEVIRSVFDLGADGYYVEPADAAGLEQLLLATEFRPIDDVLTSGSPPRSSY
jgi:DNA-binding NarL/FixJ family response regulator